MAAAADGVQHIQRCHCSGVFVMTATFVTPEGLIRNGNGQAAGAQVASPTRKQRIRKLHKEIGQAAQAFVAIAGKKLREIRAEALYKEAGFRSFKNYCATWQWHCSLQLRLTEAADYEQMSALVHKFVDEVHGVAGGH
jgi:hypothetical protein